MDRIASRPGAARFSARRSAPAVLTLPAVLALLTLLQVAGLADPAPAGVDKIQSRRVLLSNGIEALLMPDATSRVVTVISVIGAGSSFENERLSGAGHFLEHMLFNGTARRTQAQLYEAADAAGGFNNAFTRRTHAAFMMTMPSSELPLALDLQSDMIFHSRIPAQKFEKERGIILEEFAQSQESGSARLAALLERETYPGSPYGLPILGSEASIRKLERDEVWTYYRRLYVPENVQIVLMGGFDPPEALARLEESYGSVRPSGRKPQPPAAPAAIASSRVIRHRLEVSGGHLRLLFNAPALARHDGLAREAAVALLTNGVNSPLYTYLEQSFPGSILSCSGALTGGPDFGRLQIDLSCSIELDPEQLLAATRRALDSLTVPDAARLRTWQTSERASQTFARQRSYMYAPLYSEEIALRGLWGLESRPERIEAVTQADLRQAAQGLFAGPSWAILITPEPAHASPEPAHTSPELAPAPSTAADSLGRARKNTPPAEAGGGELPLTVDRVALENGSHLLLLGAPADGSFSLYVLIDGRNFLEPAGQEGITELLHRVMSAGPQGQSEAAFQDALEGLGAEMQTADRSFIPFDDYYTQRDFSFVRFQCLDEFAAQAFALLGQMLARPALAPEVLDREKARLQGRLAREARSARALGSAWLADLLYGPDHPLGRSPYGTPAGLAGITRDDLVAYHERWLDPRRVWIGVLSGQPREDLIRMAAALIPGEGGGDPRLGMTPQQFEQWQAREQAGAWLEERLGALAAHPTAHGLAAYDAREAIPMGAAPLNRVLQSDLQTGTGGRTYVLETLLITPPDGTRAGSVAWSELDGAVRVATGVLSARLAFDLRERRGMAYGIGASLTQVGDHWLYRAGAETRAENTDALAAGFVRIRREALLGSNSSEWTRTAQKQFGRTLRQQEMRLNQAMYTVWDARQGKSPLSWWSEAEARRHISPAAVEQALRMLAHAEPAILLMAR